jgi:hypothetical protein
MSAPQLPEMGTEAEPASEGEAERETEPEAEGEAEAETETGIPCPAPLARTVGDSRDFPTSDHGRGSAAKGRDRSSG